MAISLSMTSSTLSPREAVDNLFGAFKRRSVGELYGGHAVAYVLLRQITRGVLHIEEERYEHYGNEGAGPPRGMPQHRRGALVVDLGDPVPELVEPSVDKEVRGFLGAEEEGAQGRRERQGVEAGEGRGNGNGEGELFV